MRGRGPPNPYYQAKIVEYTLLRNTGITYRDLSLMSENEVWTYYAMYLEERQQEEEEMKRAKRQMEAEAKMRR